MAMETVADQSTVLGVIPGVVEIPVVWICYVQRRKAALVFVAIQHAVGAGFYLSKRDISVLRHDVRAEYHVLIVQKLYPFSVKLELREFDNRRVRIHVIVAVHLHYIVKLGLAARQRRENIPILDRIKILERVGVGVIYASHAVVVALNHVYAVPVGGALPDISDPEHYVYLKRAAIPYAVKTV